MSKIMNPSVENFIKELKIRISLLNSNTTRKNLNEDNYNKLNDIINSYINRSSSTLTTTDIVDFKVKDIKEILNIIGLDQDSIERIISDFNNSVNTFKDTYNQNKLVETTKYFDEIRKMIETYLQDYQEINENKNDTFDKTIEEYQKIIQIFEQDSFESLFDDFESLFKLMNNLAIPNEDKWQILEYIASKNIACNKHRIVDINLAKKVYDVVSKYLMNETGKVRKVENAISKRDVDIDLIPHIASSVAKQINLNEIFVKNTICALVLNGLFDYYKNACEVDEDEEVIESIRSMIDDVLKFYVKEENEIIKEARRIIEISEYFYNEHKNNDDILNYLELSISEIENEEITRDMAIDLKTLPIIKTISETLDKIERLPDDSEDYDLCCGILNELIEAYNSLLLKKEHVGLKRINGS